VYYYMTVTYDGNLLALYLNGALQSYKVLTGKIRTTSYPFLMAQMLPGQPEYNFKGVLDAVKIFNYALTPDVVKTLYAQGLSAVNSPVFPEPLLLSPNPVSDMLTIQIPAEMDQSHPAANSLQLFDQSGQVVLEQHKVSGKSIDLDLRSLGAGVYVVVLTSKKGRQVGQFIKM